MTADGTVKHHRNPYYVAHGPSLTGSCVRMNKWQQECLDTRFPSTHRRFRAKAGTEKFPPHYHAITLSSLLLIGNHQSPCYLPVSVKL